MNIDTLPTYFLAANSAGGFCSEFKACYRPDDGWVAYIIKGGPGTGKSSLMRYIATSLYENGYPAEICRCSSDPHSLDGVIFPTLKTVLLDGTSPHIVEPTFPAVCEQIINTGDFWDAKKIKPHRKAVIDLCRLNSAYHKKASQYITAAGQVLKYNFNASLSATDIDKTFSFGTRLAKRHIPRKKGEGHEWVRFLSGITPDGPVFFGDTLNLFKTRVIIRDEYGAVAGILLSAIRDYALSCGHEIITVKNAVLPSDIIDHIIIPDLSLCFCRECRETPINDSSRRIHARRFMNMAELHKNRQKIAFNRRVATELLVSAGETLACAKAVHDEIEKYYVDAMDFKALSDYADKIIEKILP